jgi:putative redox protein
MTWGSSERVEFPGASGDKLAARLDQPPGPPIAYALFAHCFTCSKDVFAAKRIAEGLIEHGIAVLRFDFTGLGHSDGEFANTNFSSNIGDLIAAADWLRTHRQAPAILIGHSLGGAAVLAAANHVAEAQAVCTIAAPFDPEHVKHNFDASLDKIESEGVAEVNLAGRVFTIKKQFLDDIAGQSLANEIARMRKALLVFHGPLDQMVGIENAGQIFQAAKHPKTFISLDQADHLLTRRADADYVADIVAAWAKRNIHSDDIAATRKLSEEGHVVISETGDGKFRQTISVNGTHILRADEPPSVGGDDSGPAPYDFLLAGLGACTSMTIRMYAERKNWPLEDVTVDLKHDKVHAKDCADCETAEGRLDLIEREITLAGALDDEQRGKLLEIADKCPVHRTLHGPVKIRSSLKA